MNALGPTALLPQTAAPDPGYYLVGTNTLMGQKVCDSACETLGEIKEIMLDMRTGQASYAVLSFGGFLGIGQRLFAVPWSALELDSDNQRFMLNPAFSPANTALTALSAVVSSTG